MTQILIFSPYSLWTYHGAYESAIARACEVRGAKVEYLLCDGLLPECDLHWDSKENAPRSLDLCRRCQEAGKRTMQDRGTPHRWLGEFISSAERGAAFAWAQGLHPGAFAEARYEEMPLAHWVQSTVISYFREYPPDLTDWHVANVYRGFLYSGALVATGLRNYLKENQVDATLLFNGRQSITRVALELFREAGIRVLTHERPEYTRGHVNVRPNTHCMNLDPFGELWRRWSHITLDRASLEITQRWLSERMAGVNLAWLPFNSKSLVDTSYRAALGFSADKQLWVLFTSSTDETAGDPVMRGTFESQHDWVRKVVDWVADRPEIQLIVKVHPNLGGNDYIGKATNELRIYEDLKPTVPDNIRIALPEDALNAYLLAKEADVGLAFGSVIGLEMAMLGKPVVLASRSLYEHCTNILKIFSKESLPDVLEKCVKASPSREIQREAFRLAYCYISKFEMDFPALNILGLNEAVPTYIQPEDLAPGKDISMDRICNYLLEGDNLYASPTPEDLARDETEENEFFDQLVDAGSAIEQTGQTQRKDRVLRDRLVELMRRLPLAARNAR